jgi:hypothetical protein
MKYFYKLFLAVLTFLSFNSFGQAVTLTTEVVPAAAIFSGEQPLIYTFKLHADAGSTSWQNITLSTSGTYTATDVLNFYLYVSTTNSITSGSPLTSATSTGSGEFLTFPAVTGGFNAINPITAGSATPDRYFFLVANLKPGATSGKTIFVNGAVNPALVTFTPATSITNSQSNLGGIQTITTRTLTLSTETLPVQTVYPSQSMLMYTLKVTSTEGLCRISNISVPFSGTLPSSEIESIGILQNTINDPNTAVYAYYPTPWFPISASILPGSLNFNFSSFAQYQPFILNGTSKYFFISVKFKGSSAIGSTLKINGATGPAIVTTPLAVNQTNSQTDVAGVKTVMAPSVTQTTETLPTISVYNNQQVVIYKMKIDPGTTSATLSGLTVKTSGTYAGTDVSSFQLGYGTATTMTTIIPATVTLPLGTGEIIGFAGANYTINPSVPAYIYVLANIKNTAVTGRIIKVNGGINPAAVTYSTSSVIITNSQSDLVGSRIITASNVSYTALVVPPKNLIKSSIRNVIYKAKISSPDAPVKLQSVAFITSGSYLASDLSSLKLVYTSTDDESMLPFSNSVNIVPTGNGEILNFTIPSFMGIVNGDGYLWILAEVNATASLGRNIKINAATNPTSVTFTENPTITSTLSNIADFQTIVDLLLTLSTIATPLTNVYQGENGNPMYILKVDAPSQLAQIRSMVVKTTGTYTGNGYNSVDLRSFTLFYNNVNDFSTATFLETNWANAGPSGGFSTTNQTYLSFYTPVNIPAGQSGYFFLAPWVRNTGVVGHTMKVDGSANPITFGILGGGIPTITNNQTDIGGVQTIIAATVVPTPTISASSTTFCNGNSPAGVTLTGTNCPGGSQTAWFLGGSSVAFASTNGSIVVTPSTTSTYTVSCMGTGTSSGTSTSVTITPVNINQPTGLSALPTSVTTAGTPVTLTATGCGAQTVVWENLSTINPRIVIPTATNIYTFRCSNAPCTSSGQGSVTVLFGPCPLTLTLASTADDVPAGTISKIASQNPGGNISATNKVTGSANVFYTARVIDLNPGFLASPSAVFKAEPGGCL